jgi:hypothetical protein
MKTMKAILVSVILVIGVFAGIFFSPMFSSFYKIEQTIEPMSSTQRLVFKMGLFDVSTQSNVDQIKYEDLVINTTIWHDGDIIKRWYDMANDTIKCYRYYEAKSLIKRIKALNKPCK